MNPSPVSVDEAALSPVRLKRSGRQKGAWVYLDAELIRKAGLEPSAEIEAMRYAQRDEHTRRDGRKVVRSRIVLNLRLVGQQ